MEVARLVEHTLKGVAFTDMASETSALLKSIPVFAKAGDNLTEVFLPE
jgi:hypothetical protein